LKLRAVIMIILSVAFICGIAVFLIFYAVEGSDWALYPSNSHIYSNGTIVQAGKITDRNGKVLVQTKNNVRKYNDDKQIRKATLHAVGDVKGYIKTGLQSSYIGELTGYNKFNGIYSFTKKGNNIGTTIDSDVCVTALNALGERKGTVGVYNYKTGEVICMVSNPTYDPESEEETALAKKGEGSYKGVFLNRFLSSTYTPGSTFKLVTTAASIDTFDDAYTRKYTCNGGVEINGEWISCLGHHGTLTLKDALAKSCNAYFSQLAADLGEETLTKYAESAGFNETFKMDGIKAKTSYFNVSGGKDIDVAWAGMGQYTDMMNPLQYLTFLGAIANGGVPQKPYMVDSVKTQSGIPLKFSFGGEGSRMLKTKTANKIKELMKNNVKQTYGTWNFRGLDICAKSGTAEVKDERPHAVFVGFNDSDNLPLAFVIVVQNGGSGAQVAGPIANTVLQKCKEVLT
ncbi:MAG: penicillin-binding protein, partial [Clostridia bacterium]|nr:penicillin-binding protein [Clostridia bacterium]